MSATLCDGSSRPVPQKFRYLTGPITYLKNLNSRKRSALLSLFYLASWLASLNFKTTNMKISNAFETPKETAQFSEKLVNWRNFRETGP